MKAYQADYSISMLCRVHDVSESGFYAWLKREPSARQLANNALGDRIEAIHRHSAIDVWTTRESKPSFATAAFAQATNESHA